MKTFRYKDLANPNILILVQAPDKESADRKLKTVVIDTNRFKLISI